MTVTSAYQKPPCVGRCSTVYGDTVCRGCKRFFNEVVYWNQLELLEKEAIWHRLDRLALRIVPQFCHLHDTTQLAHFLQVQAIRYPKHLSPASWALHCIENFNGPILHLKKAGITLKQKDISTTRELKKQMQAAIYELSLAEQQLSEQKRLNVGHHSIG